LNEESPERVGKMKGLCKLEAGSASADIERKARLICKLSLWFG